MPNPYTSEHYTRGEIEVARDHLQNGTLLEHYYFLKSEILGSTKK